MTRSRESRTSRVDVGPVAIEGGAFGAALETGEAVTELDLERVSERMVRIRVRLQALSDCRLLGFDIACRARLQGVPLPACVLAHPNLDQESRGAPSLRLAEGQRVSRGFDQAIRTRAGTLIVSCENPASWVTVVDVSRTRRGLLLDVRQRETPTRADTLPISVPAGAEVVSDPVLFGFWNDALEGLAVHAELMGRAVPALASPIVPALKGWNSWDHYGWMLNEQIALAESAAAPAVGDFRLIVLAGPWFDTFGDWNVHERRFPSGLRALADTLHHRGQMMGLWVAPFLVESDSHLFADHPEWLLHDERQQPVRTAMAPTIPGLAQYSERSCCVLDATHPGVQAHLETLARTLTVELGADYLFVDFLRAQELPGLRFDRTATGVRALRQGLSAMRAGLRPGTMLMGGSGTIGLYPGAVHAGRIGPDITLPPLGHPVFARWTPPGRDPEDGFQAEDFPPGAGRVVATWSGAGGVLAAVSALASRWYLQGRALQINPDCAVLSMSSLTEARTVVALWSLSGGLFLLGDSMISLPSERVELVTNPWIRLIQAQHRAARPVDLFDAPGSLPGHWELLDTDAGDFHALTNWTDQPVRRQLATDRRHATDIWTDRQLPIRRGRVSIAVAPHDTVVVRCSD